MLKAIIESINIDQTRALSICSLRKNDCSQSQPIELLAGAAQASAIARSWVGFPSSTQPLLNHLLHALQCDRQLTLRGSGRMKVIG